MGRVISLISGKGGVGKTTITANLGIALAKRNLNVCLIDADIAMANLSLLLNMQNSPITLHDVLLGEANIQDAIYDGPAGVKFIPSGLSLENYRRVDSERLQGVVDSIKNQFDFILLDCAAGIGKNVMAAISASDEILLITMPSSPSIADVLKAKITSQRLGTKVIGIMINFMRGEKGEIKKEDVMKMLELPVLSIVPFDDEIRKSFMQEKVMPIMIRVPGTPAGIAIQRAAAKISGLSIKIEDSEKKGFLGRFFNRLFSVFKKKPKPTEAKPEKTKEVKK
ncbi:MAG: septum site-determining protein MinD [Candidatus Diapherotrites archaeon]|uniref:Septum site-determining protein MinD n=1 Tax=Candidatus Iainarchaeum sp. TaxID=3101447 RepID=A0A2D6LPU5_9ARCH|nr:septum site-determining protein MinD [Candidatus Diapherotrites archaeon]|tara:strand:- start:4117 stop:4959 length:843 start_codon:yes stop_codon:yes gene_type:complete